MYILTAIGLNRNWLHYLEQLPPPQKKTPNQNAFYVLLWHYIKVKY